MITPPIREPWMDDALCVQTDPEAFFPEKGDHGTAKQAKAVCRRCEVTEACLQFAIDNAFREGIYGGLSPKERQRISGRRPGEKRRAA